jgi:hypothetical protein
LLISAQPDLTILAGKVEISMTDEALPPHRRAQLTALREAGATIQWWARRLGGPGAERQQAIAVYLVELAGIEAGLWRPIPPRPGLHRHVLRLVDEYAESIHHVRRPDLPRPAERAARRDLETIVRARLRGTVRHG